MSYLSGEFKRDIRSRIDFYVPLAAGVFVTLGAVLSFLGWILDIPRLLDIAGVGIQIKFNTTICLTFAGIALVLAVYFPRQKLLIRPLATGIFLITAATLAQHVTNLDFGIDEFFFKDNPQAKATAAPGRMGIPASLSLTLISLALLFFTYRPSYRRWVSAFGSITVATASLSLVGYLFGADPLFTLPRWTGIAFQTAMMIAILGIGLVTAVPQYGFAAAMRSSRAGGLLIRRLFLPILVFSLVLGWLRVAGQDDGLYDTAFGTAIQTIIEILFLVGILWWTAVGVNRLDDRARDASDAVIEREERLRTTLNELTDNFISLDAHLNVKYVNRATKAFWKRLEIDADGAIGKNIFDLFPQSRDTEGGRMLIRCRDEKRPLETEYFYAPFNAWFFNRYFPVSDGGVSYFGTDITEKKRGETARRESEIMQRLVDAQESDRHRIARDLHDHLGQKLTALRLQLESLKSQCNGNEASLVEEINSIQKYASRIDVDINYLAWELMPTELASLGLVDALRSFVREWSHTYEIEAEFHASGTQLARLDKKTETNLYRIVQEALNNILKHAGATNVSVLLENRDGQIILIIEDDGSGFEHDSALPNGPESGLGLVGMNERSALLGGTLEIETRPGEGTTLYIRVPVKLSASGYVSGSFSKIDGNL